VSEPGCIEAVVFDLDGTLADTGCSARCAAASSAAAYVGDADVDLQCAAAAGALGIHARWGAAAAVTAPHLAAGRPADVPRLLHRI
jgi:phosphoglycolate phosphatase-like HAD superfamily hydrolase